ncbi:cupin domain-containing protein [Angustibacter sp. Root456]|uniref:cupin domain-containing protein n=1 Tax=Angustibacter sp. Root456 TaxID=1736539 RepID=UPI0006F5D8C6|nr:cupin domain-containing protein [Angustibacter sp. Root456]KQX69773.1 cupin [Angustibacter sp. Root456]
MQQARSETTIDNDVVRVTTWTIGPGQTTGPHRHALDYVVVPVRGGELVMTSADGVTRTTMEPGTSYFRSAGVEHEVSNDGEVTVVFVEVEVV